jgi:hypothetical protein
MPNTLIALSNILQRRYWHNANNGKSIEKTRKRVNLLVRNQVISIGGCAIRHCNLRAREVNLYRNDGTHLSNSGTEIYLNNIQGALEHFISSGGSLVFPPIQAEVGTDVCRRYDKDLLLWHEGYSALWRTLLCLLLGFLPRGSLVYKFFQ